MQRLVDNAIGVAKESVKTLTREAFNNTINMVNGASAFVLEFVPGKASIAESLQGWEMRPSVGAPRLPQWMEDGYSSLNKFIYDADFSDSTSDSEYESGAEDNLSEASLPPSPSSSTSFHSSGSGYFSAPPNSRSRHVDRRPRTWWHLLKRLFWFFFWPLALLFPRKRPHRRPGGGGGGGSGFSPYRNPGHGAVSISSEQRPLSRTSSNSSLSRHFSLASQKFSKRFNDMMEYVTHMNDNRRRGIIEDLHLFLELAIERGFEAVRGILHYTISPWTSLKIIANGLFGRRRAGSRGTASVETTTLGDSKASPKQRPVHFAEALNTDSRNCQDIVTDAGYPYESKKVTTKDGYVLTLERIPRRESRKVVLLQHGLLDSSLGWVSNGPVGSQAFAAYDQGFDVWLGNMRGYANREHVNKRISAREYWRYSINEHGMHDMGAMVECIHEAKLQELKGAAFDQDGTANGEVPRGIASGELPPYVLSGVAHSLGGAAVMLYVVTKRIKKEPHRFSRLILLSPAGFHEKVPFLFSVLASMVPLVEPLMTRFMPGLFIPTRGLRLLFNKLVQDFQNLPALRALIQVLISSVVVGGDTSDWVGALRQPHYNMYDMPGLAFGVIKHMHQLWISKRFCMFDYGSARANMAVYGQPKPIDLGAHYHLVDIPVDVVMGRKDAIIPPSMVVKHYQLLKAAGRTTSIKEFEFAHLDFTFAQHQELLAYVMARLNLPASTADAAALKGSRRPSLTVRTSLTSSGEQMRQVAAALPGAAQDFRAAEEEGTGQSAVANGHAEAEPQECGMAPPPPAQNRLPGAGATGRGKAKRRLEMNGRGGVLRGEAVLGGAARDGPPQETNEESCMRPSSASLGSSQGGSRRSFDAERIPVGSLDGGLPLIPSPGRSPVRNGHLDQPLSSKSRRSRVTEIEEEDDSQEALEMASQGWTREARTGERRRLSNGSPSGGLVVRLRETGEADEPSLEMEGEVEQPPWMTSPTLTFANLRQRAR